MEAEKCSSEIITSLWRISILLQSLQLHTMALLHDLNSYTLFELNIKLILNCTRILMKLCMTTTLIPNEFIIIRAITMNTNELTMK
jgi:hypothetical protein